jgi:23S rRNA (adenine2503-C2)-methyltransferase
VTSRPSDRRRANKAPAAPPQRSRVPARPNPREKPGVSPCPAGHRRPAARPFPATPHSRGADCRSPGQPDGGSIGTSPKHSGRASSPSLKPVLSAVEFPTPQGLLGVYRPDVSQALDAMDAPPYRHGQVYEHLLRRPLKAFSEATTLPASARIALDKLGVSSLTQAGVRTAADGTTKLLLAGQDEECLETVMMRYRDRVTVCVSSQVGCPVGCGFCATGAMGFRRNLSVAEIVDQVRATCVLAAAENRRVSNLVYMGMGEPLLNVQAVLDSIRVVTDPHGLGLAHRAISVSTVGIPSGILRLARAEPQINLALSLHAADDRTRALLIPDKFRHPLSAILGAAWEHFALTHRKLLVEYVLLQGVNDSLDDALRLASLLRGHVVTVNLVAWNPMPQTREKRAASSAKSRQAPLLQRTSLRSEGLPASFRPSAPMVAAAFREALLGAHVEAVVRRSKGGGIQAACGQLAGHRQSYGLRTGS